MKNYYQCNTCKYKSRDAVCAMCAYPGSEYMSDSRRVWEDTRRRDDAIKAMITYGAKRVGGYMTIRNVIFNAPATIVFWSDGTKTVVKKGDNDNFDPEKGLAMAIAKKALGNKGNYYEEFKKWLPKEDVGDMAVMRVQQAMIKVAEGIRKFHST